MVLPTRSPLRSLTPRVPMTITEAPDSLSLFEDSRATRFGREDRSAPVALTLAATSSGRQPYDELVDASVLLLHGRQSRPSDEVGLAYVYDADGRFAQLGQLFRRRQGLSVDVQIRLRSIRMLSNISDSSPFSSSQFILGISLTG